MSHELESPHQRPPNQREKPPLMIRVCTVFADGAEQTKIINYHDASAAKWFANHMYWCFFNQATVATNAA